MKGQGCVPYFRVMSCTIPYSGVCGRWSLVLLGTIALTACGRLTSDRVNPEATAPPPIVASPVPIPPEPIPTAPPTVQVTSDPYEQALSKASSALRLSQSATAPADWELVADRWLAAINWLNQVPSTHPQYSEVAARLADYQRQRTHAQQQAQRPAAAQPPAIALRTNEQGVFIPVTPPDHAQAAAVTRPDAVLPASPNHFQTPIKRREGGTPVIDVLFNGRYTFEMIVDTGASGTVITQAMARQLGVVPQSTARVNTATAANVQLPVGVVDSIAVGERVLHQVPVAIATPALTIGLLGQDFFADYDLVIRETVVEFHARRG